jgi:hypothetical protein
MLASRTSVGLFRLRTRAGWTLSVHAYVRGDADAAQVTLVALGPTGSAVHRVLVDHTPGRFGVIHALLVCPRCGQRRSKLYWPPGAIQTLACRICLGLGYASQRVDPLVRARARVDWFRRSLPGWDTELEAAVARARRRTASRAFESGPSAAGERRHRASL